MGFEEGVFFFHETQLISLVHEWSKVLNQRCQVDAVSLDFAKAFDSVPHQLLLDKAAFCGIRGNLQLWLETGPRSSLAFPRELF